MSSSRSIAAARSRRAGESQPPVSGGRPVTSIASHSAFVQQQMPPPPPNNVRIAKAPMQQQQQQMSQQGASPFSKLSISDAIGLVTLRLGRVEQFIIDFENGEIEGHHPNSGGGSSIPENSKIVDNSVLTTIVNRLDALEKKEGSGNVNASSIASLEKEMKEAKDLLSHLLFKYELFTKETNEKFSDFEGAISEIEKNMESHQFVDINETVAVVEEQILAPAAAPAAPAAPAAALEINALDLKSLIKQEFSATDSN
jgi:hypothetical protein